MSGQGGERVKVTPSPGGHAGVAGIDGRASWRLSWAPRSCPMTSAGVASAARRLAVCSLSGPRSRLGSVRCKNAATPSSPRIYGF